MGVKVKVGDFLWKFIKLGLAWSGQLPDLGYTSRFLAFRAADTLSRMRNVFRLRDVVKTRMTGDVGFRLVVPKLEIDAGEKIALVGQSGCGKSTLLDMLAMVLRPSEADRLEFKPDPMMSVNVAKLWARDKFNKLSDLRRRHIGYVLQTGGLLPYLSVRENISLSRKLLSQRTGDSIDKLAEQLGIHQHLDKLPGLLSAGERQRVAIARALAHGPSIVLADEPTGSLDPVTGNKIMTLLIEMVEELGVTLVVASHDWPQVDALGLRKLEHQSRQTDSGKVTESVFAG
jgi:putative ABC transport system ATP-binding protein